MKTSLRLVAGLLASASFATIAHAGDLSSNVSDATGTRPLQSATVKILELDRATQTERDGSYIFADIPAGEYTVEVSYVGAVVETKTIPVPATGRVQGNFTLAGIGGGDILVVGQAANQASALSRQKAADGVESVLTRDAIGQFPDQNVAESLRRLPGLNILNDQGEGRFVAIRGLDPNLVTSSLNGVRLPAPESDVRQVALDVISSDTIESIEVKKSNTPDMDADGIGGSVEIHTTSAFDRKKDYYAIRAEGSYNDYSGKVTPKGGFDFSKRIGDDFGIAGSASYYKREFETDNVETGDKWALDADGNPYMPSVEYRDYDVTRTRINAALSFDWRASDTTKVYLRGNWSQFDDHEYRRRTTFKLGKPSSYEGSVASFDASDASITVQRDLKDRFERQRIRTVVLGGDTDTGIWKFNWSGSYAKSTELETFSVDPMRFNAKFKKGVAIDFDYANKYYPTYSITTGADTVNDASQYSFNRLDLTTLSDSQDEEWAAKADLARTFAGDSGDFTIQGGAKARWRTKNYDYNDFYYDDTQDSLTLADVLGSQTYRIADMGPVASKTGPADLYRANTGNFLLNDYETELSSNTDDYKVKENVQAAYLLGRWDSAALRVIAGVRVEHTDNEMNGNEVVDNGDDTVTVTPVSYSRSYTTWLPSLTVRYSPQQNLVARFAFYRNLMRPNLSDMAPRYMISRDDDTAELGNPALKPYQAWNADFGMEYYFSSNGAISFGAFYKDVQDYIITAVAYDTEYNGTTYEKVTQPINGDSAKVVGFEASYSQAYTMLPEPFDGLLTQLNYTYTYTKATILDDLDGVEVARNIPMPNSSRDTFNVVLGYEKGPIDLRVAGTYRSKLLEETGGSAEEDRYANQHLQIDLSAKYKLTENIRLFADWVNVNNAKYYAYQNFEGAKRLQQYEIYGSTVKFGARMTF